MCLDGLSWSHAGLHKALGSIYPGKWCTPVISAPGRPRQDHKLKGILPCSVSSRSALTTLSPQRKRWASSQRAAARGLAEHRGRMHFEARRPLYVSSPSRSRDSHSPGSLAPQLRLALYVYEYLLHVGAQKSAQTFLSEIRWEKNITLGEPPGFLHSWWCVFWDLYCAAPDRREACEHTSEAKVFQDYSTAAPNPVMGAMAPNDAMGAGPVAPGFFQPFMSPRFPGGARPTLRMPGQPPVGLPGSQPLIPSAMDPSPRAQGHPSLGGPMQRVTPPRGMASVGPQGYGAGMRPPPNSLATTQVLPSMNMGPGVRGPWASPSGNSIPYASSSPGSYTGPAGGGGAPGTPIMPSPGDSTNSSENMYTIMNPIGPGAGRANFPLGPGPEGPLGSMSAMETHHVNGSLGSGDMDGLPKSSPGAVGGLSNAPGTPRDDGEMAAAGTFLHSFPSESVSACVDSPPAAAAGRRGLAGRPRRGGAGPEQDRDRGGPVLPWHDHERVIALACTQCPAGKVSGRAPATRTPGQPGLDGWQGPHEGLHFSTHTTQHNTQHTHTSEKCGLGGGYCQ
ncbi:single-stranded DNA-binding protein 4 isoform X2 [Cricetulus griseus]|uniref:Single-stranded DNA-binding protein 4 isoform X2 n=1 Tax=Cricetulus griseus TaxID=10029 RepID=A0A9J7F860_CRIGR|nr:single-stranded DNA-binding protein 4 isoform X2 [Cricetulus griseus]